MWPSSSAAHEGRRRCGGVQTDRSQQALPGLFRRSPACAWQPRTFHLGRGQPRERPPCVSILTTLASPRRSIQPMAVTTTAAGADIEDVVRFIDEHWARGHALVTSRPLLDWQHRNADGGYSFVVARTDGDVAGILGYIPTSRFDPALAGANVVWLTTWKVRHDAAVAGLGLALLQHLAAAEPHVAIGAIGLNPATGPIYQALGYRLGELQHYVLPNVTLRRFELASLTPALPADDPTTPLTAMVLSSQDEFEQPPMPDGLSQPMVPESRRDTFMRATQSSAAHTAWSL